MSVLDQLLSQRGIKDITELSPQERATYEAIRRDMNAEVTVESIKKFLEAEKSSILKAWTEIEDKTKGKTDLTICLENVKLKSEYIVCEKLLNLFSGAEMQRKRGEKKAIQYLNHKKKK